MPTKPAGNFRWVIIALLFAATIINYMDRQILGLLKPELSKDLNWSETDFSNIVIAFQAAYAMGQVFFGPIIEWIGTKAAFSVAIVFWSIAAMAHAAARSAFGFGVARVALGLGESGNFPAAIKTVAEWCPRQERALATGIFNSGSNIGAIVGPVIVPMLAYNFGWQMAFIVLGVCGFVWLGFWLVLYQPPKRSTRVSAEELAYIESTPEEEKSEKKISWRQLLSYRQTWAYVATGVFVGPVWWFYLFWLPDFFNKQFGLDIKGFGGPLVVVYSITALGSIGFGWLSSWLLKKGWQVNMARKGPLILCAACTVPVIFAVSFNNVWIATGCFALAAAGHQGWSANMYTVVSDIFPKRAVASVVGLGGTISAIASMGFSYLVGSILQGSGVYDKILLMCGSAYLIALLIFHVVVPKIHPIKIED